MPNDAVPASHTPSRHRRLLLVNCSKAKLAHEGLIPALNRYDGPAFRVIRRYFRHRNDAELCVYILSAEFGLIPSDQHIPHYDRQMTSRRARELRPQVRSILDRILPVDNIGAFDAADLLIVLSKDYLSAILDSEDPTNRLLQERVAGGQQGSKLSVLHDWLYGTPPEVTRRSNARERPLVFRGVELALTRADVLALARLELRDHPARAFAVNSWSVAVDGQRVAPKWLVSQATGLPVSRFTTSDALSLLARLGIEAERV